MPEMGVPAESVFSFRSRSSFERKKKEWNFATLHDLHVATNSLLRQAMLNERSKRWHKVIESYKELLWMISLEHFPEDYEPPSNYSMLLYELHFHLGVAYQHVGNHIKAAELFSKTIQDVSIAKNGCLAGCLTNSCLMTPVYARRAFATSVLGQYRPSIKDAERAVVLDSGNPYVYCIRALVRSTFDDEIQGLHDLNDALKIDKDHVCATMLKASFTKPLYLDTSDEKSEYLRLKQKAVRLCQEAETYLTCNNFQHPCILEFYDKFLFPLSVPHTITRINLTPDKPSKKQLDAQASQSVQDKTRPVSSPQSRPQTATTPSSNHVFRCGTAGSADCNRMSLKRRVDYGNAIRQHMGRPQSAEEFFKQLDKQRKRETDIRRAQSAILRPGDRFAKSQTPGSSDNPTRTIRPETAPTNTTDFLQRRKGGNSTVAYEGSPLPATPANIGYATPKEEVIPKLTKKKQIQIEAPNDCAMSVFQPMNIKCAPRMYYRPWIGDKLPASERKTIKYSPKFY